MKKTLSGIGVLLAGLVGLVGLVVHVVKKKKAGGPRFHHDCLKCRFLGRHDYRWEDQAIVSDLWVHEDPGSALGPSFIARFGNEGPEYASMPEKVLLSASFGWPHGPALMVAYARWKARN